LNKKTKQSFKTIYEITESFETWVLLD